MELPKPSPRDSGTRDTFEEWLKKDERKEDGDKSEGGGRQVRGRRQTDLREKVSRADVKVLVSCCEDFVF